MFSSVAVVEFVRFPVWLDCFTWIPACAVSAQLCDKCTATFFVVIVNDGQPQYKHINEHQLGVTAPSSKRQMQTLDALSPFKCKSSQIRFLSCTMKSKCIILARHANVFIIVNLLQDL